MQHQPQIFTNLLVTYYRLCIYELYDLKVAYLWDMNCFESFPADSSKIFNPEWLDQDLKSQTLTNDSENSS